VVAVPSLLFNEAQVRGLVNDLEVRFLANRDPTCILRCSPILPDSVSKPHTNDAHPLVELAVQLIDELNAKYGSRESGSFIFSIVTAFLMCARVFGWAGSASAASSST
jgi:cyclic beta-1,2-glucan synthetase